MATPMTLREEKFHALMQRFESDAEILRLPCPGLVEYVEQGVLEGAELEAFLANLFEPYQSHPVDCVVLGCTHYPFVRETIQKLLGAGVQIFDGGAGTARETERRLKDCRSVQRQSAARNRGIVQQSCVGADETAGDPAAPVGHGAGNYKKIEIKY